MKANETNLVDYVNQLQAKGFTEAYIIENGKLKSTSTRAEIPEEDFTINLACKFDVSENAMDSQYLFGIESKQGNGYIADLLGNYYFSDDELLKRKINIPIEEHIMEDKQALKYGLKKIYKDTFNENPDRFELRIGFPDFPTCPLDQTYSMLGYDKQNNEYVWLVTSIIRDERLEKKYYDTI
ncbi:MAG: hypothetical protein R2831_09320 [Chitinophagaceae bacterium]